MLPNAPSWSLEWQVFRFLFQPPIQWPPALCAGGIENLEHHLCRTPAGFSLMRALYKAKACPKFSTLPIIKRDLLKLKAGGWHPCNVLVGENPLYSRVHELHCLKIQKVGLDPFMSTVHFIRPREAILMNNLFHFTQFPFY